MDKNGFLLAEETLKIVLAVIGIGLLVFLLVSIYYSSLEKKQLESAKILSEKISSTILNEQENSLDLVGAPSGWVITSWPYQGILPLSCSTLGYTYCICICNRDLSSLSPGSYAEDCNKLGVCIENTQDFSVSSFEGASLSPILIDPPKKLQFDRETKSISISS